jgi:hypothetical protein
MRNLVFKNLTSDDRRKRIITSCEVADKRGVHSVIQRHFVCMVKEVKDYETQKPSPYLFVLKERNTKDQKEKFFCKIKGSVCAVSGGKIFLVLYMHTLRIDLTTSSTGVAH